MKPSMVFSIVALIAIVVAASFGVQLSPVTPRTVPESVMGTELYVCPATGNNWDLFASAVAPFNHYIVIAFFAVVIMLMFVWGWALYQNLLNDKFKPDLFAKAWRPTKFVFWAGVILLVATMTPNHFRRVHINGASGEWVLCENNTPGARAVRASAVSR